MNETDFTEDVQTGKVREVVELDPALPRDYEKAKREELKRYIEREKYPLPEPQPGPADPPAER